LKAALAVLAIILFFVLYLSLVIGLGYLVYLSIKYPLTEINKMTILGKIGAISGSAMLFAFTLKFIFKLKNHKPDNRIKLNIEDQPTIFSFTKMICRDTGAPKPKSIFVDPDVNAYVSYSNIWKSLFFPVKKELTIGMGLISSLNLSEFKAVISHEFGHFAQRSMKIGSYIMSANTIIHDMIFERDKWDEALAQWRGTDLRLAFIAWIITPIVWLIRQLLNLFYQFLNIMHASLSREMEFNADKVAVATTGSESIISGLWKLDNAQMQWNSTLNHIYLASQKSIYVNNIYSAYNEALENTITMQRVLFDELPNDNRGGKLYFSTNTTSKSNMYASHPPNDLREANAKQPYIHCPIDDRSPWILFDEDEKIQQEMTSMLYEKYFNTSEYDASPYESFRKFVHAENHGLELLNAYSRNFNSRFLTIPDDDLFKIALSKTDKTVYPSTEELQDEVKILMEPIQYLNDKITQVQEIAQGQSNLNSITIDNKTYRKNEMESAFQVLNEKREQICNTAFVEWDRVFCLSYFQRSNDPEITDKLYSSFIQYDYIKSVYLLLIKTRTMIHERLAGFEGRNDVTDAQISFFADDIAEAMKNVNDALLKLNQIKFVSLPNIDSAQELVKLIVEREAFDTGSAHMFQTNRFNKLMESLDAGIYHCERIEQKSIITILLLHEDIDASN